MISGHSNEPRLATESLMSALEPLLCDMICLLCEHPWTDFFPYGWNPEVDWRVECPQCHQETGVPLEQV